MIYVVKINDKEYEVEVEQGKASIVKTTSVAAPAAAVAAPAPAAAAVPAATPAPAAAVEGEVIEAPMPGTILDIKVAPGSHVKRGETLLILEAMKMENEIAAPRDAVVSQVLVSKGASVSTYDALISIQ